MLTHSSLQDRDHSALAITHGESSIGQGQARQSVIAPHKMRQTHLPPKVTPCSLITADEPACQSYVRVTIVDSGGAMARGCLVTLLPGSTASPALMMCRRFKNRTGRSR